MGVRGFYFSLDALLSITILIIAIVGISTMYTSERQSSQIDYLTYDLVTIMSNIRVSEINNTFIEELITNGSIVNPNSTLIEQIGEFWAKNQTSLAEKLAGNVTEELVPKGFGFGIYIENDLLYERATNLTGSLVSSRRMISGIEKGKPVRGATSRAYLVGVKERLTAAFAYFGGFVGQGNLTKILSGVPADAVVTSVLLEADIASNFTLYLNGTQCGGTYAPTTDDMNADTWDISSCNASILKGGDTNITIIFLGLLNESYIGGGYLRVDYKTNTSISDLNTGNDFFMFPGIRGVINQFSSFFVPGSLQSMRAYLHYNAPRTNESNTTLYLTIGNRTVFTDYNSTTEQSVYVEDATLSSMLNYGFLSNRTVPIRLGFSNLSYFQQAIRGKGIGDAVLITDRSGSMYWPMFGACDVDNSDGLVPDCSPGLAERIAVAQFVDENFTRSMVEGIEGNRVGLVGFGNSVCSSMDLTDNVSTLAGEIGTYGPADGQNCGSTCIACGIYEAVQLLNDTSIALISEKSEWTYSSDFQSSPPPNDGMGRPWTNFSYDDSSWEQGYAILGFGSGADTVIHGGVADLWELQADRTTPEVDFTSGMNSSWNTFGLGAGDDGWDWQEDTYDYNGGWTSFNGVSGGELEMYMDSTSNDDDISGAYGVQFEITPDMAAMISSGGTGTLSFHYEWDDNGGDFESSDEVWVKSRLHNATQTTFLGSELSAVDGDSTLEIASADNPNNDFSGTFTQDVSALISNQGTYYLDFGCKLFKNRNNEDGWCRFDNVMLEIKNVSGDFYFRKKFTVSDLSTIKDPVVLVYSDDSADVYLNGVLVDSDPVQHAGEYWNREVDLYRVPMITEDFESGTNGWTDGGAGEEWELGVPANGPSQDHTPAGTECWGTDLNGDYEHNAVWTLDSPEYNISDLASPELSFWVWVNGASGDYLQVFVSTDGGMGWTQIDDLIRDYPTWTRLTYDLNNFISDEFRVRFTWISDGVYPRNEGAYIDDLVITEMQDLGLFQAGDNIIAVKLANADSVSAGFDLSLIANPPRKKAMLIMSDGDANRCVSDSSCNDCGGTSCCMDSSGQLTVPCDNIPGIGAAGEQAINLSCWAHAEYNISIYAVAFGNAGAAAADILNLSACCDSCENFYTSNNVSGLAEIYQTIAQNMTTAFGTIRSQTVNIIGELPPSELFPDSYIELNYTPIIAPMQYGEVPFTYYTEPFVNCSPIVPIPSQLRIVDAKVTSYSGEHWTSLVGSNGQVVYNLSDYSSTYEPLGDPFIVQVPAGYIVGGNNYFTISTGDGPANSTGCSEDNSLIYTGMFRPDEVYSPVLEYADGCKWTVEYEDLSFSTFLVESTYNGSKRCFFTSDNVTYDHNDTIDNSVYQLLSQLDFDKDGRLQVKLNENNLQIEAFWVPKVPYMWGPSIAEVRVWQ